MRSGLIFNKHQAGPLSLVEDRQCIALIGWIMMWTSLTKTYECTAAAAPAQGTPSPLA